MSSDNINQDHKIHYEAAPGPIDEVPAACVVKSSKLFGHSRTLLIEHAGERYRLQITRNEKLILTK